MSETSKEIPQSPNYISCSLCMKWLPVAEDSLAPLYGFCPHKQYPSNKTAAEDSCPLAQLPSTTNN